MLKRQNGKASQNCFSHLMLKKVCITGIRYGMSSNELSFQLQILFTNVFYFDQEAQLELERLIKENAEMEERLQKLEGCQDLVTKDETDQIKKLHQVPY